MYEFGKIVLVPFPFTDLRSSKLRPALIVSKENSKEDLIVCFIGSTKNNSFICVEIESSQETGLKLDSFVYFDKIATLSKKIILGELGKANSSFIKKNKNIFFEIFGFYTHNNKRNNVTIQL